MHPGWVDTPGIQSQMPDFYAQYADVLRFPSQGADTIVWLACAPANKVTTGHFWLDRAHTGAFLDICLQLLFRILYLEFVSTTSRIYLWCQ